MYAEPSFIRKLVVIPEPIPAPDACMARAGSDTMSETADPVLGFGSRGDDESHPPMASATESITMREPWGDRAIGTDLKWRDRLTMQRGTDETGASAHDAS
jgi:hypothetical protein